jgi:hypothetical protein
MISFFVFLDNRNMATVVEDMPVVILKEVCELACF